MVHLVEMVPDPATFSRNNKTKYQPVGAGLLVDFNLEDAEYTFIAFMVLVTIFLAVLLKAQCMKWLTFFVPESGLLLLVGLIVSHVAWGVDEVFMYVNDTRNSYLTSYHIDLPVFLVQHVLIPPIILHASYELYNPQFFNQLASILTMAIVGTTLNTVIVALGLYIFNEFAWNLPGANIFHALTFSAIISAVDPVAVLAVFEDVEADRALYFLVFGEALLNDGVTFVLYEGVKELAFVEAEDIKNIPVTSYIYVLLSFLTAPLGGFFVGFVAGLVASLVAKYTSERDEYLKPILNLLFACLAYMITLLFGFSNILGLIAYGIAQTRYGVSNMSAKASCLTTSTVKLFAILFETLLFFILGSQFDPSTLADHWDFVLAVIFLITVARLIVTCGLCFLLNKSRKETINWKWQAVMVVGGLRGAIAFAMVAEYDGPYSARFYDCVIVVVLFTTLVQGIVAKPLVETLRLKKNRERNPKIRETQRFQEFENAVKAESISSNFPSLSLTATWMEEQGEEDEGCCRSCWRSFEQRVIAPVFTREGDVHSSVIKELYEYEQHTTYLRQMEAAQKRRKEAYTTSPTSQV